MPGHRRAPSTGAHGALRRNATAILDATERLLARRASLSIVAIAAEAGVSRPTLYAHYKSIAEIIEAAVGRSVVQSLAAFEEARPGDGPADQALLRMAEASWKQLGRYDALARGAAEHLSAGAVHRTHEAMLAPLHAVIERGRRDGVFRSDLPADWLMTLYFSIVHGADEHAAGQGIDRAKALQLLKRTLTDLFRGGRQARPGPAQQS